MHFAAPNRRTLSELFDAVEDDGARLAAGGALDVAGIAPVSEAGAGVLSFSNAGAARSLAKFDLPDGALLIAKDDGTAPDVPSGLGLVLAPKPRRWFIQAMRVLFGDPERGPAGIHALANVEPGATIHPSASIGPFVTVSSTASIAEDAVIQHGVFVGPDVHIGARTLIRPGTVLGVPGQALERDSRDRQILMPHLGGIVIGSDIIMGANSVVMSGSLQPTRIGNGAMIGNHVNIGHNSDTGEEVFIAAGSVVAGSVRIGRRAWIAPSVTLLNKVRIGENAMVGLGSTVMKPVPDDGYVLGNPAVPMRKINRYNK